MASAEIRAEIRAIPDSNHSRIVFLLKTENPTGLTDISHRDMEEQKDLHFNNY